MQVCKSKVIGYQNFFVNAPFAVCIKNPSGLEIPFSSYTRFLPELAAIRQQSSEYTRQLSLIVLSWKPARIPEHNTENNNQNISIIARISN